MKKCIIFLFAIVLIVVGVWTYHRIQINSEKDAIGNLATMVEEQFLRNDFGPYVNKLQNKGLSDLKLDISFSYNYDDHYDKDTKTLWLRGIIDDMTSDLIDDYYTTEFNGAEGKKLATLMKNIKDGYGLEHTYRSSTGETVILTIYEPRYDFRIHTSSGREYEYEFGYTDSVVVAIDGDWVYYAESVEQKGPVSYSGNCKYSQCSMSARKGSYYCHIHSCCLDDCSNSKEPALHCCNTHNCKEPKCGLHRYEAENSEYCMTHYRDHL